MRHYKAIAFIGGEGKWLRYPTWVKKKKFLTRYIVKILFKNQ